MNFADTAYGPVMRSTPERRKNPQTPAQQAQRDRIRRAARGYAALTSSQVLAWGRFAAGETHYDKKGNPFTPNGYQAYSSLSATWYAANGTAATAPANPPAAAYPGETITIAAAAGSGVVSFTASGTTAADTLVEVWLQPLRNANRKPSKNGYRVVGYLDFSTPPPTISLPAGPGAHAGRYRFIDKTTGERTALIDIPVSGVSLALSDGGADEAAKPAVRKKAA